PFYLSCYYFNQRSASSGNRAFYEHEVVFGIYKYDFQIFLGYTVGDHSARHSHSFRNMGAESSSDGTRFAFGMLLSVRSWSSMETVALDHSLETLTFGNTGD